MNYTKALRLISLPAKKHLLGFTLAEVLITLGIIGIVAAMTLPSLIIKNQEKETVTRLKKFYSSISQAFLMAKSEYGTPDEWYTTEAPYSLQASNTMNDNLTKYMKLTKNCKQEHGCLPNVMYKKIDKIDAFNWETHTAISKFVTSDGMSVFFYSYGTIPTDQGEGSLDFTYGAIYVDVNGFKKPNIFGRDMFSFIITKEGIFPSGSQLQNSSFNDIFPNSCNRNSCHGFCEGCTAWVLHNENMDYMRCDDLSWDGKTKCD